MALSFQRALRALVRHNLSFAAALVFALVQLAAMPARAVDLLDGDEDFTLLSSLGFEQAIDGAHADGTRKNDYAWSMAWFNGKLYVGTGQFEIDPATGQPGPGQLWAYTPAGASGKSGTWKRVYQAPSFLGGPREFGYRWMTQCSFRGTNYLFISTLGTLQGNILYTTDGVNFDTVSRIGYPLGSVGFRTMVCFTEQSGKTTLITTPVGQAGDATTFDSDRSANPIVLANDDPAGAGSWRNYSPLRMGDPDNNSFFSMVAYNGFLYAGVSNEVTGAQVWRTRGCSNLRTLCAPQWTKLVDKGGGRPFTATGEVGNRGFSDMIPYNGALYLAVSAPALDGDRIVAELWRMRGDDTFEVLVGEARLNFGANGGAPPTNAALPWSLRCGVPLEDIDGNGGANDCAPTTRRGAGYGVVGSAATGYPNGPNAYFWRTFVYAYNAVTAPKGDNRLYMSTLKGGRRSGATPGFQLLATTDGVNWSTVTDDGLGYPQQQGVRSITATPYGLAMGGTHFPVTVNPETDVRGCNVWLGVPLPDGIPPVTTLQPPSPAEGAVLGVRSVSFAWSATDLPAAGSLPLSYAYRLDPLEPAFSAFGSATTRNYANLPDGSYTFHVIARDAAGNTEAPGAAPGAANRSGFTVTAPDLPPSVTITVAPASPNATGNVTFAWTATDDLTPAAGIVYDTWLSPLQADPGTFGGGTTRSFTGLADGSYTFHVVAKDGAGHLGADTTATFSVAIPPGPPPAPSPASAAAIAARVVRVSWTNVAGETSYSIERCLLSGRQCIYGALASGLAADTTSFDDTVAASAPAGAYAYRVRACNGTGCSAWAPTNAVNVP
jgi:hypothetical protein